MPGLDCVLAAAGGSTRMGAHKLLLPFGGSTVAGATARRALEAGCRVILVVGCRGGEVAAPFRGPAFRAEVEAGRLLVVDNPRWEEGMLGSIQAGLREVRGESFFEMNADMPLAPASAYAALEAARAARLRSGAPEAALFAAFGGRAGHPVLLPSAWIPAILDLAPGGRLRAFLESRPTALVEAGAAEVLADIDTPEDYREAAARGADSHLPKVF